jgi:hypothetical protein
MSDDDVKPVGEEAGSASGSETRQRTAILAIRLTPDERNQVHERADKAGLSTGSLARTLLLGESGPRSRKRVPADRKELIRLLGEVNRVGSNLNQIAHALNADQAFKPAALDAALSELRDAVRDIRVALGKKETAPE